MTYKKCIACNRALRSAESRKTGYGPTCAKRLNARIARASVANDGVTGFLAGCGSLTDTGIVCAKVNGVPSVNLYQAYKHHSPTGFDFGFDGSGPADLALNVLALLVPGSDVELADGNRVSAFAWENHQLFKFKFISVINMSTGGTVPIDDIYKWIEKRRNPQIELFEKG